MIGRRLIYLAALATIFLVYIYVPAHHFWFFLVLALAFLPVELLVTLPVYWKSKVQIRLTPRELEIIQPYYVQVSIANRAPVNRVKIKLRLENLFTGELTTHKLLLDPADEEAAIFECEEASCGVVRCALQSAHMLDMAGIMALPLATPKKKANPQLLLVRPLPYEGEFPHLDIPLSRAVTAAQIKKARGQPEYTDQREYRAGDAVRDIHWKLSAKLDKMMIREKTVQPGVHVHLCFDLFGEPGAVGRVLGRVASICDKLLAREWSCALHWMDKEAQPQSREIGGKSDLNDVFWDILSVRLPVSGVPIAEDLPQVSGLLLMVEENALTLWEEGLVREVLP